MTSTTEHITAKTLSDFRNEPPTDFTTDENRRAQKAALAQVKAELSRTYPIIIV
jgi:1-pyrroline-5-carboxylate dehydrogenase